MLKYSNNYRRDPNVTKYALKCGLTMAFIVGMGLLLFNYGLAIWDGISTATLVCWSGIKIGFIVTSQFLNPVFSAVGSYVFWGFLAVSLWMLCVFFKIDDKCEDSLNQWMFMGLVVNSLYLLYTILYMIYLSSLGDNSGFHGLIFFYVLISNALLFLRTEEAKPS